MICCVVFSSKKGQLCVQSVSDSDASCREVNHLYFCCGELRIVFNYTFAQEQVKHSRTVVQRKALQPRSPMLFPVVFLFPPTQINQTACLLEAATPGLQTAINYWPTGREKGTNSSLPQFPFFAIFLHLVCYENFSVFLGIHHTFSDLEEKSIFRASYQTALRANFPSER